MKFLGFLFLVMMMTSAMVTQAQLVYVFYGKNHDLVLRQVRYCFGFKDTNGNVATNLFLFPTSLKCTFFKDTKCQDITMSIPPTTFPARRLLDLKSFDPSDTSAPGSFQCRFPLD